MDFNDDDDENDDTHPPRIIVRVGMVFRRGQKDLKLKSDWFLSQSVFCAQLGEKQTVTLKTEFNFFIPSSNKKAFEVI